MTKSIFIDAFYPEEVRVVLCVSNKVEEFIYQDNSAKPIKDNVYLAKIERVEPSLQAAFVDYGGNKHGFLALSEIHPRFYQIADVDESKWLNERASPGDLDVGDVVNEGSGAGERVMRNKGPHHGHHYKRYKIQDVVKKGQVLLVQITKEERGNKGVSLTTYLSISGRYCVLMPNAKHSCGVSKRIEDVEERERLVKLAEELKGESVEHSLIIRTAGEHKTKTEIKRDLRYLLGLWASIKEHAERAKVPAFIHEEGDIVKRCIRDLYDSDVEKIVISGEKECKNARDFMGSLLPRHVDKIQEYTDSTPIFSAHNNIEEQLSKLCDNTVPLVSGGYLVINKTEALVAIDVNSGKATNELNIENTAIRTNSEAIAEIARQTKLRDLSGLIVVDLIDMAEPSNRLAIESAAKYAFAKDRARVQIGKISEFGILEMTRQRLRTGIGELMFAPCAMCDGKGYNRKTALTAAAIFRALCLELATHKEVEMQIVVSACSETILSILNEKKKMILELSSEFNSSIVFTIDESAGVDGFFIESKHITSSQRIEPCSTIVDKDYSAQKHEYSAERSQTDAEPRSRPIAEKMPGNNSPSCEQMSQSLPPNPTAGTQKEHYPRKRKRKRRNHQSSEVIASPEKPVGGVVSAFKNILKKFTNEDR